MDEMYGRAPASSPTALMSIDREARCSNNVESPPKRHNPTTFQPADSLVRSSSSNSHPSPEKVDEQSCTSDVEAQTNTGGRITEEKTPPFLGATLRQCQRVNCISAGEARGNDCFGTTEIETSGERAFPDTEMTAFTKIAS